MRVRRLSAGEKGSGRGRRADWRFVDHDHVFAASLIPRRLAELRLALVTPKIKFRLAHPVETDMNPIDRRPLWLFLSVLLCGCSGAPSLSLAGAYFPAWLVCAVVAVLTAAVSRMLMTATGLAQAMPFQLAVNLSIGTLCGLLVWLVWSGA